MGIIIPILQMEELRPREAESLHSRSGSCALPFTHSSGECPHSPLVRAWLLAVATRAWPRAAAGWDVDTHRRPAATKSAEL